MRRPRLVASAALAAFLLTTILVGPAAALEPPRPLPGYQPTFVSEREPGGHWEDCLWASGAMLLDKLTNGAGVVGRDRLRALSGDQEAGSSLKDLSRAFARLGVDVEISPDDRRISWKAFLGRLASGGGAVLLGDDHSLPKRYGRWDRTFWSQTGAKDDHAVYVDRYDPRTDMVWLMDPLAWNGWTGEWIKATSLRRFAWTSGGGVVAAMTPAAQPAPFAGVKLGASTASADPGALRLAWPLAARRGWTYPGVDVHATIAPTRADDVAFEADPITTGPVAPGAPVAAPAASVRPKTLVATIPVPRDPGVYRVGVTLTDRRFGAVVARGGPAIVYVPGDRAATVSLHVSAARTPNGTFAATVGDQVRVTLVARNSGSLSWVDPVPGTRLPDDVAPLDTRIAARWVRAAGDASVDGKPTEGPILDLGPAALVPGQALGRAARIPLPPTAGRWALVVEVSDSVNGRFSGIGSAPAVVVFDVTEAAGRTGIGVDQLRRMVELGVLMPTADGRYTAGHLRRIAMAQSLVAAGIPVEGLGAAIRDGQVSLDFLDAPAFERFSALSGATFAEVAERTGVPVDLLMVVREAAGSSPPAPDDRIRDEELPYADLVAAQVRAGFHPAAIQQQIRAQGDGMRRMAETESAIWLAEVIAPGTQAGKRPDEILGSDVGDLLSALTERAVMAMYHLQQARAWSTNIIEGVEAMLAEAGLHTRVDQPPAMCFLDISGYTRLTEERGDAAAAQLAEELGTIVQRTSIRYGGRPVKWLGDGVMLHFPNPGQGVVAALEMREAVTSAGLPPAHVGLHAGPVIFQEGDYYGQTVNLAARIAAYASPGQVLVSQAVVDASPGIPVTFREIGPVELKGVAGAVRLHAADPATHPGP